MLPLSPEAERYVFSNGVVPGRQANMMDFVLQSCEQPFTTPDLTKALIHYRQVPTEPRVRYLLAKADARAVQDHLGVGFRDFLHSAYTQMGEGSELSAVLDGVISYHESGRSNALEGVIQQRRVKGFFPNEERRAQILDRAAYGQLINDPVGRREVPVIELVRRIKDYVDYIPTVYKHAPSTSDPILHARLESLATVSITPQNVDNVYSYFNNSLLTKIGNKEFGIDPGLVNVIEWLDMKVGGFVYHLSYEKQGLAYREGWFENILRFQELTGGAVDFSEQSFERSMKKMRSMPARDASVYVREITRKRLEGVRRMYSQGEIDHLHDIFVQIGGLVDIGLMIPLTERVAETTQGERNREYYAASVFRGAAGYNHRGD